MKYTFEWKLDCVEKYKKHARIEIPPGVKSKKQEEFYLGKYLIALYQADDDDTLVAFVSNTKNWPSGSGGARIRSRPFSPIIRSCSVLIRFPAKSI